MSEPSRPPPEISERAFCCRFLSQIRTGNRSISEAFERKVRALGAYHLLVGDKPGGVEIGGAAAAKEDTVGVNTLVGVGRIERPISCSQSRRPTAGPHPDTSEFTTPTGVEKPLPISGEGFSRTHLPGARQSDADLIVNSNRSAPTPDWRILVLRCGCESVHHW